MESNTSSTYRAVVRACLDWIEREMLPLTRHPGGGVRQPPAQVAGESPPSVTPAVAAVPSPQRPRPAPRASHSARRPL